MYVQIPDTTYKRDTKSFGLVETDKSKAEEYFVRSKSLSSIKTYQEELEEVKKRLTVIETLKDDIMEIKQMLKGIRVNNGTV